MTDHSLVLRTCNSEMRSHNDFQWPKKGPVSCNDWDPKPACGNGLHGLLWGVGDGGLLNKGSDAKWLVVKVLATEIVDIQDKVKFPRGEVVFCGARGRAVSYIQKRAPKGSNVVFAKFPRRFSVVTVDGVKAVSDSYTGLTWDAIGSAGPLTHVGAEKYCASLGAGWRMPTLPELRTIINYLGKNCLIDERYFTCRGWYYRSSTAYAPLPDYRWGVSFDGGDSGNLYDSRVFFVRAVRASQ